MLADLAQNTLDGLAAGASYALLAIGFTLIFGVLRRVNLSYGPAIMLGCYVATFVHLNFGAGLLALAAVCVLAAVLAGAYVERLCFAPHRKGSAIAAMVASFALWMQLEEAAMLALPKHLYAFPALYDGGPIAIAGFTFRVEAVAMLAAAVAVCALVWWILYRTRFGVGARAVIDSPLAAELSGISVGRVSIGVFALASAIGGLAGFLLSASVEQVTPMLGMWSTLKGLLAMMLGGLGSLPGAVAGALVLGLVEAHSQWFLGPQLRDFIAFLMLFVLLAIGPRWMRSRHG
ncbi:MAG: branched-chain amino acid ABC transporter permease [Betaproteobacteria bacterium]